MFQTLKKELNIVEVMEYITDTTYKPIGENTFGPEDGQCPSCGHSDCFRIKDDGTPEGTFARCFSEDKTWDVTSMVAELKEISNVDAARMLAKHYDIKLPNDYSPVQEVFNLAAEYYYQLLVNSHPYAELNGLTPLEYQEQIRRHTKESLHQFHVGWSDGKLIAYLESLGIDKTIIQESGLLGKKGADYLPAKVFIYPHYVRGHVSHFTFKDPLKQKQFQLPNKYVLNGCTFYNSDSISSPGPIAIGEGENDIISLIEGGWSSGVICSNGNVSATQMEWVAINLNGRDVVTIFDVDPAGDTYRLKFHKISKTFRSLTQIKLTSGVKDIDEYLKAGGDLTAALENNVTEVAASTSTRSGSGGVDSDAGETDTSIIEKSGCYYKIRYKDGEESLVKITDFTLELLNIYSKFSEEKNTLIRERELIIHMADGRNSKPIRINSDSKETLSVFCVDIANAMDASFMGSAGDLKLMWQKLLYASSKRTVTLVTTVGRSNEFPGWVFGDCFIHDNGNIYFPDDKGVMWISEDVGVKVISIEGGETLSGIPLIYTTMEKEDREKLLGELLHAVALNLGDVGAAIHIFAWCQATAHSHTLFKMNAFWPHFQFWGTHGQGKTTLIKLMLRFFGMEHVYTSLSSLNSGVAFARKLSYYSSLPMCIDEVRHNKLTQDWYGYFRALYDRDGKVIGAKDGQGIRKYPVRSTLIFGGEDMFTDPATRARCIPVRVKKTGRETVRSYATIQHTQQDHQAIGFHWILESLQYSEEQVKKDFKEWDTILRKSNPDSRQSRNWATVAMFGHKLAAKYFPEFNYLEYLSQVSRVDLEKQQEENTLSQFWDYIEGMQSMERAVINSDHIKRDGDRLYLWFNEIFRLFEANTSYAVKEKFSKTAIMEAVKEEPYYINLGDKNRTTMGVGGVSRRCIAIDLTKAGEALQLIAKYLE